MSTITYSIGILPHIKKLKREIHDFTQLWYADDSGALGMFVIIDTYFNSITRQGLGHGYYPEPSKSVLIVHPENLKASRVFGERNGFKVCTVVHYLRGYIGDEKYNINCLRERTLTWEKKIGKIRKTAGKYPQESYAAVARAIQPEWRYLQRVIWDTGDVFAGVENTLQEYFCFVFCSEIKNPSHSS